VSAPWSASYWARTSKCRPAVRSRSMP
jgi:hypothetical protein